MCLDMSELRDSKMSQKKQGFYEEDVSSPVKPELSKAVEEMKNKLSSAPKPPLIGKMNATAQSQMRIIKLASKQ